MNRQTLLNAFFLLTIWTIPAVAETVDVKYQGLVPLDSYQCTSTQSSFVHRVCYDRAQRSVLVLLKSTYYAYCDLDELTVSDWLGSESKGRFYNTYIRSNAVRGKYDCSK